MDRRRTRRRGRTSDDADARGEHRYPDAVPPDRRAAEQGDAALTRAPGRYAAGADGTQEIATPRAPARKS